MVSWWLRYAHHLATTLPRGFYVMVVLVVVVVVW